ncbi:hypothetical protein [Microbacterium xylanilyticum]
MKHYTMSTNAKDSPWYFVIAETIHDAIRAVESATRAYVNFGLEVHRTEPKWNETLIEA